MFRGSCPTLICLKNSFVETFYVFIVHSFVKIYIRFTYLKVSLTVTKSCGFHVNFKLVFVDQHLQCVQRWQ